jgi:hypothetical protein
MGYKGRKLLCITNRLKEELIRELVQSSKQTDAINSQYLEKIKAMDKVDYCDFRKNLIKGF